jgi:hypothetical protein
MSERVRSLRYLTKHYLEKLLKHGQKIDKDGLFSNGTTSEGKKRNCYLCCISYKGKSKEVFDIVV